MTQVRLRPHKPSEETPPWVMPWNAEGLSNESVRRSVELSSMAFRDGRDGYAQRAEGLPLRRVVLGLLFIGIFCAGLLARYGRFQSRKVKRSHPRASG